MFLLDPYQTLQSFISLKRAVVDINLIDVWLCCFSDSDLVSFNGHSSLLYRLSPWPKRMSTQSIYLKFKTLRNSGILLHAEGQNDQSLTLELEKGKLFLLFRKGINLTSLDASKCISVCNVCM